MTIFKLKLAGIFLCIFILSGIISCSKSTKTDNNSSVAEKIEDDNFNESNEDLMNVDYKEFYDDLASYGEWIEVTDKDIGLDMKKETSGIDKPHRTISASELFGVKDAYAGDVAFGAFFIWRPSPNLAVSVSLVDPEPYYVPYTNGQWIYSDDGWYFLAPTHCEEIVHHYGRWIFSPELGWVWIPGRVWAPAWVEWRVSLGYIAWAPVPPCVYFSDNVIISPPIYEDRFVVVENRYFCEPFVYKYREHGKKVVISEMTRIDGVMIRDKKVINKGPDVTAIEKDWGRKIDKVKINKVQSKKDEKFTGKEINSYSAGFTRIKNKGNDKSNTVKPDKFSSYDNARNKATERNIVSQKENNDKGSLENDKSFKNKDNDNSGNNKNDKSFKNRDKDISGKNDKKDQKSQNTDKKNRNGRNREDQKSGKDNYKGSRKDNGLSDNNKSGNNKTKRDNGGNLKKFSKKKSQGDNKNRQNNNTGKSRVKEKSYKNNNGNSQPDKNSGRKRNFYDGGRIKPDNNKYDKNNDLKNFKQKRRGK